MAEAAVNPVSGEDAPDPVPSGLGDMAFVDYSDLLLSLDKDVQIDLTQQQQPLNWGNDTFAGNGTGSVTFDLSHGLTTIPSCVIVIPFGWSGEMSVTSTDSSIATITASGTTFTNGIAYGYMYLVMT